MKAYIKFGNIHGNPFEVRQYSNDWITLDSDNMHIMRKLFSPDQLAFTSRGITEMRNSKGTGLMFLLYEVEELPEPIYVEQQSFGFTFVKRKK